MSTTSSPREQKNKSYLIALARDLVSVASLGILLLCIHYLASPFFRGFQCDDESIRYPHKESTVPSSVCYLFGSGLNIAIILIAEYQLLLNENPAQRAAGDQVVNFPTKLYLRRVSGRLLIWFFGAISSELFTDISKVTIGRLRPHFIDVCRPTIIEQGTEMKFEEFCSQNKDKYQYITNYYCHDRRTERDARLSFMSGHSSYSAYSATFAIFYLQSVLDVTKFGLIKPGAQVLIAAAAFYTGLTRVSDYKHHWQDVLAGLTQGTLVASVFSLYVKNPHTNSRGLQRENLRAGEELNFVSY